MDIRLSEWFQWCVQLVCSVRYVVLLVCGVAGSGGLCDNDRYGYIGRFRWSQVRGYGEYWCRSVVKLDWC